VGLTYIGPLIGTFIGAAIAGPLSDYSARVLSKRNKGIYEPEFKLPPVILYSLFGIMGFVGYGWSLQVGQLVFLSFRYVIPLNCLWTRRGSLDRPGSLLWPVQFCRRAWINTSHIVCHRLSSSYIGRCAGRIDLLEVSLYSLGRKPSCPGLTILEEIYGRLGTFTP
jgi:hypothetical protein